MVALATEGRVGDLAVILHDGAGGLTHLLVLHLPLEEVLRLGHLATVARGEGRRRPSIVIVDSLISAAELASLREADVIFIAADISHAVAEPTR